MGLDKLKKELKKAADKNQAAVLRRFFKTGPGEYGEGDVFWGINVPAQRKIAKKYLDLDLREIQELLNDPIHELRLTGLIILVNKYETAENRLDKKKYFEFYLQNTERINNWDLVDVTAPRIIGDYLLDKKRLILYRLMRSNILWERRIAIVSCFAFIRKGDFRDTFLIAEGLLSDKHDLIHKAVGWMLREVGKRDQGALKAFLDKNGKNMPRTMLRYAIERFDTKTRKHYLSI